MDTAPEMQTEKETTLVDERENDEQIYGSVGYFEEEQDESPYPTRKKNGRHHQLYQQHLMKNLVMKSSCHNALLQGTCDGSNYNNRNSYCDTKSLSSSPTRKRSSLGVRFQKDQNNLEEIHPIDCHYTPQEVLALWFTEDEYELFLENCVKEAKMCVADVKKKRKAKLEKMVKKKRVARLKKKRFLRRLERLENGENPEHSSDSDTDDNIDGDGAGAGADADRVDNNRVSCEEKEDETDFRGEGPGSSSPCPLGLRCWTRKGYETKMRIRRVAIDAVLDEQFSLRSRARDRDRDLQEDPEAIAAPYVAACVTSKRQALSAARRLESHVKKFLLESSLNSYINAVWSLSLLNQSLECIEDDDNNNNNNNNNNGISSGHPTSNNNGNCVTNYNDSGDDARSQRSRRKKRRSSSKSTEGSRKGRAAKNKDDSPVSVLDQTLFLVEGMDIDMDHSPLTHNMAETIITDSGGRKLDPKSKDFNDSPDQPAPRFLPRTSIDPPCNQTQSSPKTTCKVLSNPSSPRRTHKVLPLDTEPTTPLKKKGRSKSKAPIKDISIQTPSSSPFPDDQHKVVTKKKSPKQRRSSLGSSGSVGSLGSIQIEKNKRKKKQRRSSVKVNSELITTVGDDPQTQNIPPKSQSLSMPKSPKVSAKSKLRKKFPTGSSKSGKRSSSPRPGLRKINAI
uniref:Uncharacterized protein n=1 Tax=Pseudo-nitzschia australis TaxID=44445 RepID=A0A7S4AQQ5_9STRA